MSFGDFKLTSLGRFFAGSETGNKAGRPSGGQTDGQTSGKKGVEIWYLDDSPSEVFFVSTFALLGRLAGADEFLDEREEGVVRFFIDSHLNLAPAMRQRALGLFNRATKEGDVKSFALRLKEKFGEQAVLLETVLDMLLKIAMADGTLADTEEAMLSEIAEVWKIDKQVFEREKTRHLSLEQLSGEDRFYGILGLRPDCSDQELRESFNRLAGIYSPEKSLESGVPPDFVLVLSKKMEDMEEAYNVLCARRKIGVG